MAKLNLKKLDEAPDSAKKVLERLIWGPPRGSVGDIKNPGPGVTWLLEENFMVPLDQRTVILPREVGIATDLIHQLLAQGSARYMLELQEMPYLMAQVKSDLLCV